MKRWLWLALLLLPCAMHAQVVGPGFINYVTSAPSGACSQGEQMRVVIGLGTAYTCQSGTWAQIGGAASSPTWDAILSPVGNQTLTMTGFSTTWNWGATNTNKFTFDTTGNPTFGLVNSTTAVTNSPTLTFGASYQNAGTPTFAADTWGLQVVTGAGTNGRSDLMLTHSGTSGIRTFNIPAFSSSSASFTIGTALNNVGIGSDGSNNLLLWGSNSLGLVIPGSATPGANVASGGLYAWTSGAANGTRDTGLSRCGAAAFICVGNGTAADATGLVLSGNKVLLTSDFTDSNSSGLQVITGLSFALPNVAKNWSFHCSLTYSEATPIASDQFGVASLTTAATNLHAWAHVVTTEGATAAQTTGDSGNITTTTPTSIVTFTPVGTGIKQAEIDGSIEVAGAGASTLQFYVTNGTAADVIVVKRDSYCAIW